MTYQQKTQRIGFIAILLGLLGVMGVAGGVEFLPPEAGFVQWFSLLGATGVSLSMMLFGVSLMNESME